MAQQPSPPQTPTPEGRSCRWEDYQEAVIQQCVLPLSYETSYKGSSGRIAILGGSELYVGAPYFCGMASLQTGSDLVSVYTAEEAATPLKCLSPDLMVQSIYRASDLDILNAENIDDDFSNRPMVQLIVHNTIRQLRQRRVHCVVIGPGMGRHTMIMDAMALIIKHLVKTPNLYLILDADALYMLSLPQHHQLVHGYSNVILTPNKMEYDRLFHHSSNDDDDQSNPYLESATIVQKGLIDHIHCRDRIGHGYACSEVGGMKRCGGIGDVLAGTIATFLAWQIILDSSGGGDSSGSSSRNVASTTKVATRDDEDRPDDSIQNKKKARTSNQETVMLACYAACCLVKRATKTAFDAKQRAMSAQDVIQEIGPTFHGMMRMRMEEQV